MTLKLIFMDSEKQDGAVAGLSSLFLALVLGSISFGTDISTGSTIVLPVMAIFFGLTGIAALLRPKTVGPVVDELLNRISDAGENIQGYETQQVTRQEGENQSVMLDVNGNDNHFEFSQDLENAVSASTVSESSNEEIISHLRKEILTSSDIEIIEMVEQARTVARLRNDEQNVEWLDNELTGYQNSEDNVPDYRIVEAVMDLSIKSGTDQHVDMRDEPCKVPLGTSVVELQTKLTENATHLRTRGPIHPALKDAMGEFEVEQIKGSGDKDNVDYLIDLKEINLLLDGLRAEIKDYIEKV